MEFFDALSADFEKRAPMTAAQAATVIFDGIRANHWRILVGDDAEEIDKRVRADPEDAYSGWDLMGILADDGSDEAPPSDW